LNIQAGRGTSSRRRLASCWRDTTLHGAVDHLLEMVHERPLDRSKFDAEVLEPGRGVLAEVHGITMLVIDGFFVPEKVGQNAIEEALTTSFEGLAM
jgi:hypothetical protein